MSWLRIDDKFVRHPKLTRLTRAERWTWLEVLSYCAEYKTGGKLPDTIQQVVPFATKKFLSKAYDAKLLDDDGGDLVVHDWDGFNPGKDPSGAVRQQRFRNAHRNGDVTDRNTPLITPHTQARAAVPVPVPSVKDKSSSNVVLETSRDRDVKRDDDGNPLKFEHMRRLGEP